MRRVLLLIGLVSVLGACAGPGAQAPTATVPPTMAPTAAETAIAEATASPVPSTSPTARAAQGPRPTATQDPLLPTPPPRITAGPTAAPFPLAAGWWDSAVCYEVFVRSFFDSDGDGIGDLNGLTQQLDYINDGDAATTDDLGATCIWLMPVAEAASYHGYDTIDYYTIEQDYGSNDDFKRLTAEAAQRGIKVVIDLVLNHTSSQHPWFQEALNDPNAPRRDWYLWSQARPTYKGPWGQVVWHPSPVADEYYYGIFWDGMPDLNYRNPDVTAEALQISRFWVEEMGVAGFRLDAIKHLIEYQSIQEGSTETFAWLREYRAFLARELPGTYTIGEIFDGNPRSLAPYYPDQLDSYFEFDVAKATRSAADVGLASLYLKSVEAAVTALPFQRWSPFLTNHDQNRVMNELDDDPTKAKLAALALLTLPGMPYIYYGEEIGMLGLKPDENIRTPMQWSAEAGAGFTTGVAWRTPQPDYRTKNVAAQTNDPASLLSTYRSLIQLHVSTPALATGDFTVLKASDTSVAAFLRQSGADRVLVLINFSGEALSVTLDLAAGALPAGTYGLEPLFGAPNEAAAALTVGADGATQGYTPLATLPARTGFIFRLTPGTIDG